VRNSRHNRRPQGAEGSGERFASDFVRCGRWPQVCCEHGCRDGSTLSVWQWGPCRAGPLQISYAADAIRPGPRAKLSLGCRSVQDMLTPCAHGWHEDQAATSRPQALGSACSFFIRFSRFFFSRALWARLMRTNMENQ
jgi:hypothetical protein